MSNALITNLTDEREQLRSLIANYSEAAAAEGRDLAESELETIKRSKTRIDAIDVQLDAVADDLEIAETTAEKLRMVAPSVVTAQSHYRSAGEILYDLLHQNSDESRHRMHNAMKRAAEHMGTDAANTVATAGDLGGLVIKPTVGAIVDPYPSGMPLASAIGLLDAPNGLHFMRPRLVDPDFTTAAGPQGGATPSKEKDELPSKKFDVSADPIALNTVGNYINISTQLISLQPGSLQLIVNHLRRRLEYAIDKAVAATVTGTGATPIATATDAATTLKAIYDAAAAYFTATGSLPSWVAMGPKGWARLGALSDAAGRPMFPFLGAANADGTSSATSFQTVVAGLRPVVTAAITDAKLYIGGPDAVEGYIYRFPTLEAVEPSILGRQVAVAAAIGTHEPIADSTQVIS